MIEKHIILEDIDLLSFYGANNANLQMLKALYPKLRIVARDNVLRVMGDEGLIAEFEENIGKLCRHCSQYNQLTEEDIVHIMKGESTRRESAQGVIV